MHYHSQLVANIFWHIHDTLLLPAENIWRVYCSSILLYLGASPTPRRASHRRPAKSVLHGASQQPYYTTVGAAGDFFWWSKIDGKVCPQKQYSLVEDEGGRIRGQKGQTFCPRIKIGGDKTIPLSEDRINRWALSTKCFATLDPR